MSTHTFLLRNKKNTNTFGSKKASYQKLCVPFNTRQSAQWGTYTPEERYRQFLTSTKYAALTGDGRMDEFHADSYIP